MASKERKISYFNTLIFTIVTGIVSLALLGLLFFDIGKDFIVFLVTLEVGIFVIIGYCIYRIVSHERQKQRALEQNQYVVDFNTCPEYYVKRMVGDTAYCFNDYTVKDANGNAYIMKVYPVAVNGTPVQLPPTMVPSNQVANTDYLFEKFPLRALENDNTLKTQKEKCALLYNTPADRVHEYSHLPSVPWTYAQSRCASFVDRI